MSQLQLCFVRKEPAIFRTPHLKIVARFDGDESDHATITAEIKYLRELLGMPPIYERSALCKHCGRAFMSQYKNGSKQVHFCNRCRHSIARADAANMLPQY